MAITHAVRKRFFFIVFLIVEGGWWIEDSFETVSFFKNYPPFTIHFCCPCRKLRLTIVDSGWWIVDSG
jgi:hypothetical protein